MRELIFRFKNGNVLTNIDKGYYKCMFNKDLKYVLISKIGYFKVEKDESYNKKYSVYRVLDFVGEQGKIIPNDAYRYVREGLLLNDNFMPVTTGSGSSSYFMQIYRNNYSFDGNSVKIDLDKVKPTSFSVDCIDWIYLSSERIIDMLKCAGVPAPVFAFKKISGNKTFTLKNISNYIESYLDDKSCAKKLIELGYADYVFFACKWSKRVREQKIKSYSESVKEFRRSDIPDFLFWHKQDIRDVAPLFNLIDEYSDYVKFLDKFEICEPHYYRTEVFRHCVEILMKELKMSKEKAVRFVLYDKRTVDFWDKLSTYYRYAENCFFLSEDWVSKLIRNCNDFADCNIFFYRCFLYKMLDYKKRYDENNSNFIFEVNPDSISIAGPPVISLLKLTDNSFFVMFTKDENKKQIMVIFNYNQNSGLISYSRGGRYTFEYFEKMNFSDVKSCVADTVSFWKLKEIGDAIKNGYSNYTMNNLK